MKKLELNQMEQISGEGFWGLVGCIALGVATGNPVVGLLCGALLNPTPAYQLLIMYGISRCIRNFSNTPRFILYLKKVFKFRDTQIKHL